MRVLQMVDSLNLGGTQKMLVFLAESVQPLKIELSVASLKDPADTPIARELKLLGADVHSFDFPHLFNPKSFFHLLQFVRTNRFDVIHAHLSNANILGVLMGKLASVPVITSLRSSGLDVRYQKPGRVKLENWVVRHGAKRVMGNGWSVGEFARKRYSPREIDVLPNAVELIPPLSDPERYSIRRDISGDASRTLILSVGRLTPIKGFSDLIAAFNDLHQSHPSACLVIAGEGDQRPSLEAQIGKLNLAGHVFLLGARQDVPRLLGSADLYVNSSLIEGLPVSVLEAMAAGLPVIATRVGDNPNVVIPGTGLLVDPHQPEQMASALRSLLDNPELCVQLGRKGRDRIAKDFNRARWLHQLISLYAKVTPAALPILLSLEDG